MDSKGLVEFALLGSSDLEPNAILLAFRSGCSSPFPARTIICRGRRERYLRNAR